MNCSNTSPSQRLQLFTNCPSVGTFPRGAVLQEEAAPAWVPHGVTSPSSKPTSVWAPLSTGPQVLAGACCSVVSPWGHSLLQASPPPAWGPFHGLQVGICSTVDLHGLQGHSLPHHGLLHGLQGNLCSGAWSTSSTSFFVDLGVCRVVSLTCSHSSLPAASPQPFLPPFFNTLSRRRCHHH